MNFEDEDRLISPVLEDVQEERMENTLRPKTLEEYIGQDKVKENMKIYIEAAKKEGSLLTMFCYMDHQDLEKQHLRELFLMK